MRTSPYSSFRRMLLDPFVIVVVGSKRQHVHLRSEGITRRGPLRRAETVSSAARYCPDRDVVGIVHTTKNKLNTHMFALIIFIVAKINKKSTCPIVIVPFHGRLSFPRAVCLYLNTPCNVSESCYYFVRVNGLSAKGNGLHLIQASWIRLEGWGNESTFGNSVFVYKH